MIKAGNDAANTSSLVRLLTSRLVGFLDNGHALSQFTSVRRMITTVVSLGSFRLDYEYEIEYEYDFRISNQ